MEAARAVRDRQKTPDSRPPVPEETIRRRVRVGAATDPLEREADRVAALVVPSRPLPTALPASSRNDLTDDGLDGEAGAEPATARRRVQRAKSTTDVARSTTPRITRARTTPTDGAGAAVRTIRRASHPIGPDGGTLDDGTSTRIQRAAGGGRPLDDGLRQSFEGGFGTDFSKVRIHTGNESADLNRSMSARAFTSGSHIFFGDGQYDPDTVPGQRLIAHELTHVVQHGGADTTINRALGLEFETGWHVFHEMPSKNVGAPPVEVPYRKEEPIYGARNSPLGWAMETDGLDIEFVVQPPFDESPAGLVRLNAVMATLLLFTNQLDAVRNLPRLTPLTHPGFFQTPDPNAVIRPNGDVLKAQPQATVGIRLDRIDDLFREMAREGNQSDLTASQGTTFYALRANAAAVAASNAPNVNGNAASDELKGFLTLVNQYLKQGDQDGRRAYAKDIAYAMSRTDFVSMFNRLPEQAYFQANPNVFVAYVLTNAGPGFAGTGTDLLIKQRIADGQDTIAMDANQLAALPRLPLTRGQWLRDISQGTDRLTQAATINTMAYTDVKGGNRLRAMGLLGNTTDNVGGNNLAGIIVELRQMKRAIPATDWNRVARGMLTYLIAVNDHTTNKANAGQVQYGRV